MFDHDLCLGEKPSHSFKYKGELKINSFGITLSLNIFFALYTSSINKFSALTLCASPLATFNHWLFGMILGIISKGHFFSSALLFAA